MTKSTDHTLFDAPPAITDSDGGAVAPSLDTQETSEQLHKGSSFRDWLTSGQLKHVAAARRAYESFTDDGRDRRLLQYDGCRSVAWFVRHKVTGKIRVAASRCGLRWCPLCIKTRRMILVSSVAKWMEPIVQPKFLTLTLKHTNSPLSEQIDNLYRCFKELKRRPWFKKRVFGGVWFFQVKQSEKDGLFHPHLHILFQGRYLKHDELSLLWYQITKGSKIVDIRAVKDRRRAVEYVARYASAPCSLADLSDNIASEVVQSLHNRRIVGTFGTAKGIRLTPEAPADAKDWEWLASFYFVQRFKTVNSKFSTIWDAWTGGYACPVKPEVDPPPIYEQIQCSDSEPITYKQLLFNYSERI